MPCEHELDDDCVCILCGFDACEAWYYSADRTQKLAEMEDDECA